MNVTLRQIDAFVALAQTGGFTGAAARLHVTQSALSALVKDLEEALGAKLVHRTTRSVMLSEMGVRFLPFAQRILDDLDRAKRAIAELKSSKASHLSVAVPHLMACTLMPTAVAAFTAENPGIEVSVVDCAAEDVGSRVLVGEVDLGVGPERTPSAGLAARALFSAPLLAVFPDGHALAEEERVSWEKFARYPTISLRDDYTRLLTKQLSSVHQIELEPAFEVDFMTTALSMVAAGLGVTTCLPYADSLLELHALQRRELDGPAITRDFFVYSRSDRVRQEAESDFVDFLDAYSRRQGWTTAASSNFEKR